MTATTTESVGTRPSPEANYRVLQRIILPAENQRDTVALYVDGGAATGPLKDTMNGKRSVQAPTVVRASEAVHAEDMVDRRSMTVRPGVRLSFGTYFNAFPASYWRRWTALESVRLSVTLEGVGAVIVHKSNARGALQRVESVRVSGAETVTFDLPLKPFGDGGWYWFDLVASSQPLKLIEASWQGLDHGRPLGEVTLEITTMNKPDFCVANITSLGQSPEALEHVKEVLIVDQGSQKVSDQAGFEEAAALLKGRLRIINQSNLGGSGGFSRGMYEAVQNGSDYVLLCDDDIVIEPESIERLLTFSSYCVRPTLVGAHMFDLYNRTALHTMGEVVNPWRFQPDKPVAEQVTGYDLAVTNLRSTSWMHRRIDADYNGWWMELIPTSVIKEIGLSLPVFIKWDDAEYGLRAKAAGYPTVSLPGAAVWHISWGDKDDLVGWQAYFHERNRVIAALLHSPYERGGRLIRESNYMDVKHLISMQYYTEAGRIMALNDILAGPDPLPAIQPERIKEIRALAADFTDAVFKPRVDEFPAPGSSKPPRRGQSFQQPSVAKLVPWALKTLVRQIGLPVSASKKDRPQAVVAHQDNKWWRMSQYDSAVVSNAEGTASSWYQRDPGVVRKNLVEATRLHARLLMEWPRLRTAYREALPRITSIPAWEETFAAHTDSELTR